MYSFNGYPSLRFVCEKPVTFFRNFCFLSFIFFEGKRTCSLMCTGLVQVFFWLVLRLYFAFFQNFFS